MNECFVAEWYEACTGLTN